MLKMPTQERTINVGALKRHYVLHVPASYTGQEPVPLVLMFHGAAGTAQAAIKTTGWVEKAEREGFLVVFPEGTRPDPDKPPLLGNPQTWNDGSGQSPASRATELIWEFFKRQIKRVRGGACIDAGGAAKV